MSWGLPWKRAPLHRPALASYAEFVAFAARYGHQTTARSETVKFAVDRFDAHRTYFFDSKRFATHYRFVQRFIDPRLDYDVFLRREYTRAERRFLLGAVTHYLDGSHWAMELSSNDTMDKATIAALYERIAGCLFECGLRFLPSSPAQEKQAYAAGAALPVLLRDAVNATMKYQPVVLGVAYGRLLFMRGTLDVSALRPYDVVVCDEVPNEIPPVAGLVTGQLQAPLAHVAVLCRSRNTPDMAHRGALDLPAFAGLEGELVKLTVGAQDFSIERARLADAEAAWSAMRPASVHTPGFDASVRAIQSVAELTEGAAGSVGAKAAQLGALARIEGIATPRGIALPFAAYLRHAEAAGVPKQLDALLAGSEFTRNPALRAERLNELRTRLLTQPVEPALLHDLYDRLRELSGASGWILRSSSNAEDLPGFSGAGLYDSISVPASASEQQVADALRGVWASLWLQRAFEERDWYRIDHRGVAMAVLVQPLVDAAVASGVAISGNPFQTGSRGAYINTQISGHTVTGAAGNELPEQFLVTTWTGVYEFELLGKSSLAGGALILADADLTRLCDQLFLIHDRLLPREPSSTANAMDVEFILTQQREFVIVQARPYTIVYNADRADIAESRGADLMRKVRRIVARFVPNRLAYRPQDP